MKLRVAGHTDRLEAVIAFYRDRVGFPELGRFVDHDGYDGRSRILTDSSYC
jgi:YycE-like N-terminal domain